MTDPTAIPTFAPPAAAGRPLAERVQDTLRELGLNPSIDKDGDVEFHVEDQTLFVRCQDGDFPLMRVFGQWQLPDEPPADQAGMLQRCNDMTLQLNVVKIGMAGNSLLVCGEHVVGSEEALRELLPITINLVLSSVAMWFQSWQPEPVEDDASAEGAQA